MICCNRGYNIEKRAHRNIKFLTSGNYLNTALKFCFNNQTMASFDFTLPLTISTSNSFPDEKRHPLYLDRIEYETNDFENPTLAYCVLRVIKSHVNFPSSVADPRESASSPVVGPVKDYLPE